jgi:neutral ceramidase
MQEALKAGVAITDISPQPGVELGGYPHHPRPNRGVHDPLHAACLFLDDGATRLAVVTMDLLMFSKTYVRQVREQAARRCRIPAHNIMICCTHTHSSPWTATGPHLEALMDGQQPNRGYLDALQGKLVELLVQASVNTFEARLGIGKGYCGRERGVGGNRREPQGVADPEVWTIGVQDAQGNWRACLVKYALHPTFLHSDNFLVSADYPGYVRKYLGSKMPGMVLLFAQGTSGNQSPRYFRSGKTFAEAERVGTEIGREAERVLQTLQLRPFLPLQVRWSETDLERRKLPKRGQVEAQVDEARKSWEEMKAAGAPERKVWNAELRLLGIEDTLSYIRRQESAGKKRLRIDDLPAEIQVIGIGDLRIVGVQGEIFVEFGLMIQFRSPFAMTFVIELANGCLPGYAATARAYVEGGYETGASLLTGRSGEQLVEAAVKLLHET